jgi:hypothetical protein
MSLLHFRCKERRRTMRVALIVPLSVHGQTDDGEKFCVQALSQSVNRNGGMLQMSAVVVLGQPLILVNEHSRQSIECRVVSIKRGKDGKTHVGVEFVTPDANFWHMAFPIPGARPLRRLVASKASA